VYQAPKFHLHPIHPLRARGTIDGCALDLQVVCYFVQSCRVWNVAHKSHGTIWCCYHVPMWLWLFINYKHCEEQNIYAFIELSYMLPPKVSLFISSTFLMWGYCSLGTLRYHNLGLKLKLIEEKMFVAYWFCFLFITSTMCLLCLYIGLIWQIWKGFYVESVSKY
jgi:hypothetical protein